MNAPEPSQPPNAASAKGRAPTPKESLIAGGLIIALLSGGFFYYAYFTEAGRDSKTVLEEHEKRVRPPQPPPVEMFPVTTAKGFLTLRGADWLDEQTIIFAGWRTDPEDKQKLQEPLGIYVWDTRQPAPVRVRELVSDNTGREIYWYREGFVVYNAPPNAQGQLAEVMAGPFGQEKLVPISELRDENGPLGQICNFNRRQNLAYPDWFNRTSQPRYVHVKYWAQLRPEHGVLYYGPHTEIGLPPQDLQDTNDFYKREPMLLVTGPNAKPIPIYEHRRWFPQMRHYAAFDQAYVFELRDEVHVEQPLQLFVMHADGRSRSYTLPDMRSDADNTYAYWTRAGLVVSRQRRNDAGDLSRYSLFLIRDNKPPLRIFDHNTLLYVAPDGCKALITSTNPKFQHGLNYINFCEPKDKP